MKTQEKSIDNTHNWRLKDDKTNDFLLVKKVKKEFIVQCSPCNVQILSLSLAMEENLIFRRKHELNEKPDIHNSSMKIAVEINKIRTELICTQFKDRIFFIVTQYNKIGTLVKVTQNNIVDETGTGSSMYSTDILMGKDEPMSHVVARNLITQLSVHKPILLSVALKDSTAPTVKTIAKILPSLV